TTLYFSMVFLIILFLFFFFSSRRRHTRSKRDWSSDVCSSDLFINRKHSDDGFLCNMIGRMILETCANVDEAIELLQDIPHRHSFSYIILDPSGETYIVE